MSDRASTHCRAMRRSQHDGFGRHGRLIDHVRFTSPEHPSGNGQKMRWQSRGTAAVGILSCFLIVATICCPGLAAGGPVIIDGTDANDHGFASGGVNQNGWLYMQEALENLAGSVTPSAARVVVDLGTSFGQARAAIDSAFDRSSLSAAGWTLQHVTGTTEIGNWLDKISIANTGILYIPTAGHTSGDLSPSALAVINTRAAAINNFVSGAGIRTQGGALFSMAESGSGAHGWLNTLLPGIIVTDRGAGGVSTRITLTPEGTSAFPGLPNSAVGNAIPWHNNFSGILGGLQVLGTAPLGGVAQDIILGGGAATVISPMPVPGDPLTRPLKGSLATLSENVVREKPTIVLTHGWQPLGDYNPTVTPLSKTLTDAVLLGLRNPDGTLRANVLTYQWPRAYFVAPQLPRAFTESAGAELARELKATLGPGYTENIHLVGHSFGTLVNSSAARLLKDAFAGNVYGVDQLTFLDAPVRDFQLVGLTNLTYYSILPKGTVQYLDNFYGTLPVPFAFGAPLPGAAPDDTALLIKGGEAVPFKTHGQIQSDFYAGRVGTSSWVTAVDMKGYRHRPAPQEWPGLIGVVQNLVKVTTEVAVDAWRAIAGLVNEVKDFAFKVGNTIYRVVVDAARVVIKKSADVAVTIATTVGDVATAIIDGVSAVGNKVATWLHLKESSPVMVGRELTVPTGAELFMFDFDFVNIGDGDWLTLHFDEQLRWSFLGEDFVGDSMRASVPLADLEGRTGTLYFTLHSVGQQNAEVLIGEFGFMSFNSQVPAPPTIILLWIGLAVVLVLRVRVQRTLGGSA